MISGKIPRVGFSENFFKRRFLYGVICYIERGWITQDEYENLNDYLYKPYFKMGGNGAAKRIMQEVDNLPIRKTEYIKPINITETI